MKVSPKIIIVVRDRVVETVFASEMTGVYLINYDNLNTHEPDWMEKRFRLDHRLADLSGEMYDEIIQEILSADELPE